MNDSEEDRRRMFGDAGTAGDARLSVNTSGVDAAGTGGDGERERAHSRR